jgi:hypothetical protein
VKFRKSYLEILQEKIELKALQRMSQTNFGKIRAGYQQCTGEHLVK